MKHVVAALGIVGIAAVYVASLDADIGFWDTGEMQTVPYVLGLAHTTGFPTEILMGWVFGHVVAIGNPAFRMTLLCALCIAFGAWGCARTAMWFGAPALVATAAAAAFAFTPVVWAHATHVDVIDPAVALAAATLVATLGAALGARQARRGVSRFAGAGALAGLTLGTHGVAIWYLPSALFALLSIGRSALLRSAAAWSAGALIAASLVYAYLPLRSGAVERLRLDPTWALGYGFGTPIWDWGAPNTPANFLAVLDGSMVDAGHSLDAPLHVERYLAYARYGAAALATNYHGVIAAVIVAAAVVGAYKGGAAAWPLLLPFLLTTAFAASFGGESDPTRYFIFPLLCLWSAAAVGVARVVELLCAAVRIRAAPVAPLLAATAMLAFAGWEIAASQALFGQKDDRLGTNYVRSVEAATGDSAIVIAPWVYATPLAYAAYVERSFGRRTIVFDSGANAASRVPLWLRTRPVFAISEDAAGAGRDATFVERLHVNGDAAHDPRLFRFHRR